MNYRHIYHAGNFADIIKHITLIAILNSLKKKDKPFAVLDAFAGLGLYNLLSEQAIKTAESQDGIGKILNLSIIKNPLIKQFTDIVKSAGLGIAGSNIKEEQPYYPGSPWIIEHLLRQNDRLIATELHPQDYAHLRYLFSKTDNTAVHLLDAYNAIKAFVPFKENRGLIFLDPPFEEKNEFEKLAKALQIINHRAANICSMIWYPIKDAKVVKDFYQNCRLLGFKETLIVEFELKLQIPGMTKCGILITNPPFIHTEIKEALEYMKYEIYPNQANYKISLL